MSWAEKFAIVLVTMGIMACMTLVLFLGVGALLWLV